MIKNCKNVEAHLVNLDELFKTFERSLSKFTNENGLANSRARLRMTTLYQVAAANKGIVVGTGNKVEDFGVGFYTKYGDGGVDLSPIADLLKSQVYLIAKYLKINESIQSAIPTDGLWDDGRSDVDQLGINYNQIEWAMNKIEKNEDISELTADKKRIIEIYLKYNRKNQHKMQPIPICKIPKKYFTKN